MPSMPLDPSALVTKTMGIVFPPAVLTSATPFGKAPPSVLEWAKTTTPVLRNSLKAAKLVAKQGPQVVPGSV